MTTEIPEVVSAPPLVAEGMEYRIVEDEGVLYLLIDGSIDDEQSVTMVMPLSDEILEHFVDISGEQLDVEPEDAPIEEEEETTEGKTEPWAKRMGSKVKKATTDPAGVRTLLESNSPKSSIKGLDIQTLAVLVIGFISLLLVIGSWIF